MQRSDFIVDDEFIRTLISSDEICRGRNGQGLGWPLLTGEDLMSTITMFRCARFKTQKPLAGPYYRSHGDPNSKDSHFEHFEIDTEKSWRKLDPQLIVDRILELGRGHLIVAGGSVAHVFQANRGVHFVNDYDFFFIGLNPDQIAVAEDILAEAIRFLDFQRRTWNEENPEIALDRNGHFITWSEKVVTVKFGDAGIPSFQFILRLYPNVGNRIANISLPIGGFDLHSCAVARALDENGIPQIYTTLAGAFALGTMTNVLMTSRMSTSMIPRLSKYRHRGFDIYFPGTTKEHMAQMTACNVAISQKIADYMDIVLPNLSVRRETSDFVQPGDHETEPTDYDPSVYQYRGDIANFKQLLAGRSELYAHWANDQQTFWKMLKEGSSRKLDLAIMVEQFKRAVTLKHSRKRGTTQNINKRFTAYAWYFGRIFKNVIRQEVLNTDKALMKNTQKLRLYEELAQRDPRMIPYLEETRTQQKNILKQAINRQVVNFAWMCDSEFDWQLNFYMDRMLETAELAQQRVSGHRGLQWNTTNPLTQLTASNNPTVTNARLWWGHDNYVSFRVGFPNEIYWLAKQICLQGGGPFYGKDIFKNIMIWYFVRAWSDSVGDNIVNQARLRRDDSLLRMSEIPDPENRDAQRHLPAVLPGIFRQQAPVGIPEGFNVVDYESESDDSYNTSDGET